jgi:hypothetical protein
VSGGDELRVVLAGASSGIDPGRLARRHGCGTLLRASPGVLERMGALPALIDALRIARGADADAYRANLAERGVGWFDPFGRRLRSGCSSCTIRRWRCSWPTADRRPRLAAPVADGRLRRATEPGLTLARRLAAGVAESGGLVVSGLRSAWTRCTRALSAGGVTVAVLGCGVDVAYPHQPRLYERRRGRAVALGVSPARHRPLEVSARNG